MGIQTRKVFLDLFGIIIKSDGTRMKNEMKEETKTNEFIASI